MRVMVYLMIAMLFTVPVMATHDAGLEGPIVIDISETLVVTSGQDMTFTVGGNEFEIEDVFVGQDSISRITINGQVERNLNEGDTFDIDDLAITVDDISTNSAVLSFEGDSLIDETDTFDRNSAFTENNRTFRTNDFRTNQNTNLEPGARGMDSDDDGIIEFYVVIGVEDIRPATSQEIDVMQEQILDSTTTTRTRTAADTTTSDDSFRTTTNTSGDGQTTGTTAATTSSDTRTSADTTDTTGSTSGGIGGIY